MDPLWYFCLESSSLAAQPADGVPRIPLIIVPYPPSIKLGHHPFARPKLSPASAPRLPSGKSRKAAARRSATRYAFWSVSESVSWPPTTCLVCVETSRDKEGEDGMEEYKSQSKKTIVINLLHLLSSAAGVCLVIIGKRAHKSVYVNHLYPLGDLLHFAQHPTACQMCRHCRSQHEKNPHMPRVYFDPSLGCGVPSSTTNRDTQGNGGRSNSTCIQATREELAEAGRVSKERRGEHTRPTQSSTIRDS